MIQVVCVCSGGEGMGGGWLVGFLFQPIQYDSSQVMEK